jgi:hypothetical protein
VLLTAGGPFAAAAAGAAGAVADAALPAAALLSFAGAAALLSAPLLEAAFAGFLLPSLKSVTYHPEPFSWNPAAVSWRLKVGS